MHVHDDYDFESKHFDIEGNEIENDCEEQLFFEGCSFHQGDITFDEILPKRMNAKDLREIRRVNRVYRTS